MIRASLPRAGRTIAALPADRGGTALIEFAITLPFLIALFVGGFQISDATSAYRKVTMATRTIADLASQYTEVTTADLDTILNASQQVLSPYSASNAKMTISQINVDAQRAATVDWSRGKNTTGLTERSTYNLPNEIKQPNTSVIVAQVNYTYRPNFYGKLLGTIPMTETIIMSPRSGTTIEYQR